MSGRRSRGIGHVGVDVGTSGCKAVLLRDDGTLLHTARAAYPTRRRLDGEVTQDPRDWLRAVRSTLRVCARAADGTEIAGIGLTAPAHVAVLSDTDGEPVARSLLAFDGRPAAMVPALRDRYGPALRETTFVELSGGWTLPQLAWLRQKAPELWPRIRWLLTQKDWIRFRLTGVPLIDASDAAGTAMVDQLKQAWLADVCADLGFFPEQLPPIVPATAPGGGLLPRWARATGIPAGTPVVVGATDTAAELVSLGAIAPGSSLVKIASTGTVVGVSREPIVRPGLLTYPHAVPGHWYTLGATNTAAVAYQWLRGTVFATGADLPTAYAEMDAHASRAPAGAGGVLFLPFLEGERTPYWDANLRGALLGLSSAHRREHLARAVLEGVAFAIRGCRDEVVAAGLPVDRPFLGGGGAGSDLWRRILVSVLRVTGRMAEPQGPAIGAAVLAAASGARDAADVAAHIPAKRVEMVRPVTAWAREYEAVYETYRTAAAALADVSHQLVARSTRDHTSRQGKE